MKLRLELGRRETLTKAQINVEKEFNFPHLLSSEPFLKRLMQGTIYVVFWAKEEGSVLQAGEKIGKDKITGLA